MAADHGIFIRWQRPIAGREGHAVELFNSLTSFLAKQQQQGNIESFEPALLSPDGSTVGGYFLVRGSRQNLDKLSASEDYLNLLTQGELMVKHLGATHAYLGEAVKTQMGRYQKYVPQARLEIK